jgi:hypothetical protein
MGELQYPEHGGDELRSIRAQLRAALVLARSAAAKTKIVTQAVTVFGSINIEQNGGLRVRDLTGVARSFLGQIFLSGDPVGHGLLIQRPDNSNLLDAWTKPTGAGMFRVYDDGQQLIFSNDDESGIGIGRPYLRAAPQPARFAEWPSSTSATFESIQNTWASPWQPKVRIFGYVYAPSATTAEARVLCDGVAIGPVVSVTNNAIANIDFIAAIPGLTSATIDDLINLAELQLRRTAGTGTVRASLQSVETHRT